METASSPAHASESPGRSILLTEQTPGTPKPPFDPPRRRSSLAFSKTISSPASANDDNLPKQQDVDMQTPDRLRSNTCKKRIVLTPLRQSGAPPGHVAQVQRFFQSAKASLHLDMHFAASPAGSINSRLPSNPSPSLDACVEETSDGQAEGISARNWRYSTVPQLLAATSLDVREPVPDSSPTLPGFGSQLASESPTSFEPTSSGFASPVEGLDQDTGTELPSLPPSSLPESIRRDIPVTTLESSMVDLNVNSDQRSICSDANVPPNPDHHRDPSTGSSDSPFFLSHSANAAAESARIKRGLTRRLALEMSHEDRLGSSTNLTEKSTHQVAKACPDPAVHQLVGTRLCPDPEVHIKDYTPQSLMGHSFTPNTQRLPDIQRIMGTPKLRSNRLPSLRASATGSPLQFLRSNGPVSPILPGGFPRQYSYTPQSPVGNRISRPCREPQAPVMIPSEHFRPGWYYARDSPQRRNRPGSDVYSFSTAAAKVTGEPAAPDWRIRDSYRTDTLTPLVKPLNRSRKNGLGAEVNHRGSARFYETSTLPVRPLGRMNTYSGKNNYESIDRIRFRSSPPRPSTSNTPGHDVRKRRRNPRAFTPEYDIEDPMMIDPRFGPNNAVLIDDDTRAAVRMSIFGATTPEPLHGEREGIRELSPNVSTWRRGMHGGPQSRKKRRPSYWDGDLKEVKDSPAGRGGIASSPTISKRSMVAEMESMSNRSAAVSINYDVSPADVQIHDAECHEYIESLQDNSMTPQDSVDFGMVGDDTEEVEAREVAITAQSDLLEVSMQD